ncbi:hypothetical protein BDR03DRAFT_941010 [Suillus americanus]|nr:hypothetical protein BDR03DRAFT_941010 [Suillus americanus]
MSISINSTTNCNSSYCDMFSLPSSSGKLMAVLATAGLTRLTDIITAAFNVCRGARATKHVSNRTLYCLCADRHRC